MKEMSERLFVPLSKEPFIDFKSRGKLVEIRKCERNFSEKFVFQGRIVELRLGYSGNERLWGTVQDVKIGSLEDIINYFGLSSTEPNCQTIEQAISENREILGISDKYIGFKVQFT